MFNARDAALILQASLSTRKDKDCWFWLADSKGNFTVRSCYKLMNPISNATSNKV